MGQMVLDHLLMETQLFSVTKMYNIHNTWQFFVMPSMKVNGLCAQDHVHLLAKLRFRLLGPSNLIQLGAEIGCPSHLRKVCNDLPKKHHGLTKQVMDNKDKQNYVSIPILVGDDLKECLLKWLVFTQLERLYI